MLKAAYTRGAREAFAKFGFALPQTPGMNAPGGTRSFKPLAAPKPPKPKIPSIKSPTVPGVEKIPRMPVIKAGADVGMAMSTARHEGPGAVPGEPTDEGRRVRSIIDRAFQRNEDDFATSSMPRPAGGVYP